MNQDWGPEDVNGGVASGLGTHHPMNRSARRGELSSEAVGMGKQAVSR